MTCFLIEPLGSSNNRNGAVGESSAPDLPGWSRMASPYVLKTDGMLHKTINTGNDPYGAAIHCAGGSNADVAGAATGGYSHLGIGRTRRWLDD